MHEVMFRRRLRKFRVARGAGDVRAPAQWEDAERRRRHVDVAKQRTERVILACLLREEGGLVDDWLQERVGRHALAPRLEQSLIKLPRSHLFLRRGVQGDGAEKTRLEFGKRERPQVDGLVLVAFAQRGEVRRKERAVVAGRGGRGECLVPE